MSERILAQILADVAAEIGAVRKDERNTYQNFNFRGIDAVVNAVGPKLHKAGVVGPFPHLVDSTRVVGSTSKGNTVTSVTVTVEYSLYGPAGDMLAGTVIAEAFDSGDKATAKAMSVAMRTFLLQALCLPTDEPDPDQYTYAEPPRITEAQVRECMSIDQLREWWKQNPALQSLIKARVDELAANGAHE